MFPNKENEVCSSHNHPSSSSSAPPPPPQQHLHDASCLMISGDLLHPHQPHEVMSDDCWPNIISPTEKKRRLNPDQVKALEKKFESSSSSSSSRNRLDTDTKLHLARELGLHPRQVAVWFQNRRARWKTKKLEKDYDALRRQVDSLRADNDALKLQNRKLHSQLQLLAFKGKDDDVLPTAGPTTIVGGPGAPNQFPGSREGFCNNMFGENQSHHQGFWPWPDHHLSFH